MSTSNSKEAFCMVYHTFLGQFQPSFSISGPGDGFKKRYAFLNTMTRLGGIRHVERRAPALVRDGRYRGRSILLEILMLVERRTRRTTRGTSLPPIYDTAAHIKFKAEDYCSCVPGLVEVRLSRHRVMQVPQCDCIMPS